MMAPPSWTSAAAVVPSDTVNIPATAALYVGAAGDLTVVMAGAGRQAVTFKAVPAGTVLHVSVICVKQTLTTANNIVAVR